MTTEQVICFFCKETGVNTEDVYGHVRTMDVWTTRYMVWLYLHCHMKVSGEKLAKMFDRYRPSVLRGIRIIKHDISRYKEVRERYEKIVSKLEGGE